MTRKLRGFGFRHTLPAVMHYTTIWVLLVLLTAPVLILALLGADLIPDAARSDLWFFLLTRMPITLLALAGLAIFTTARLAGPWIALRRAMDDVRQGDLHRTLRFRRSERYLQDVERAFNAMMASVREQASQSPSVSERS